jgi:hypothetical protein
MVTPEKITGEFLSKIGIRLKKSRNRYFDVVESPNCMHAYFDVNYQYKG